MFKSLTVYQITQAPGATLKRLESALESKPFAPCPEKQPKASGFVPPLGGDTEGLTYESNGGVLFCLRTDEKTIPATAWRKKLEARRNAAIEKDQPFSKTDERLAKEEIIESFLPGIPPAETLTYAYLDKQLGLMFISGNEEAADNFVGTLKVALDAMPPVRLLGIEKEPCDIFTEWVVDPEKLGDSFKLGHQGALKYPDKEGGCGNINAKNELFDSDEFHSLIEAGRQVCSIALEHQDMDLRLTSKLGMRNISLSKERKAETCDEETGQVTTPYEFAVFVAAMRAVMADLEPILGPWPVQPVLDLEDEAEGAAA